METRVKTSLPVAVLAAILAPLSPALASSGQLDNFSANATDILAGATVDFSGAFSINTSTYSGGGSNPVEPAPVEGYQVWEVNWYSSFSETVTAVQLSAAGQGFNDFPSAGPGAGYSNSWSFSVPFTSAGNYDITLSGSWSTQTDSYISAETASRDCYYSDPGNSDTLFCSSWTWSYYDNTDTSTFDSGFNPLSITIHVSAVPEPQTLALWFASLVGLGVVRLARLRTGQNPMA